MLFLTIICDIFFYQTSGNRWFLGRFVESRGLHWVTLRSYVRGNANECQIRVERTFTAQCSGSGQQKRLGWPLILAFIFILGTFNYDKSNTKRVVHLVLLQNCAQSWKPLKGSKSTNRVFDVTPYSTSHFRWTKKISSHPVTKEVLNHLQPLKLATLSTS